jgi:hypothetical protein
MAPAVVTPGTIGTPPDRPCPPAPTGSRTGLRVLALTALVVIVPSAIAVASPPARAATRAKASPARPKAAAPLTVMETWSSGQLALSGNGPIALSSPIEANLDGQPSAVVGDRNGNLYAYHLANGTSVTDWPTTDESGPIDSTPSVASVGGSTEILVGTGNDSDPTTGGYQAFAASGVERWFTPVVNPATDNQPDTGVQAGLTVGALQGNPDLFAGSLGQVAYALDAGSGAPLPAWPFFDSDSTHSTAALADLYGTGQNEIIVGGDQSAGLARGQKYTNGGHLRILSAQGNQICRADTDQVVDSSPAVGDILPGGAPGIVVGTGTYFAGASDTDTLIEYDDQCNQVWSTTLDGSTFSSPALSDVLGNGSLQVVEGTDEGQGSSGSVYVLDAATGRTIWQQNGIGRVIGSVVTADLTGGGYDDVIVPTIDGTKIFDGQTGTQVADLSPTLGLQNSPLVTEDPNGTVGITLAGYVASDQWPKGIGEIDHYEITGSNGAQGVGAGSWPMFHHDPQLTGNAGTPPPVIQVPCNAPRATATGYEMVASDGGVFNYGNMPFCGSTGNIVLDAPMVGIATTHDNGGYWTVASDGGIFAFGDANFYGSMGGKPLDKPIVGMAATANGGGYWLVASDGGIFAFGNAGFYGSMGNKPLNKPIVGMAATADGGGYWLVASDGGIFAFGDAKFYGSMGNKPLNKPVVGMAADDATGGYWLTAADGGIFAFNAPFLGSTGNIALHQPVVGMQATANGQGYRFVAADGGIFAYGAPFDGSTGNIALVKPVVGMTGF